MTTRVACVVFALLVLMAPMVAISGDLAPPGQERIPVLLQTMPVVTIAPAPVMQVAQVDWGIPPARDGRDAVSVGKLMPAMRRESYDSEKRWRAWVAMRRG